MTAVRLKERPVRITVQSGDILDEPVDVLICSANPFLNLSGGVNGAILLRGGEAVQRELHEFLSANGLRWVPPGTVVRTSPGPVPVRHILHAVAVDGFYQTSPVVVAKTITTALTEAVRLESLTVALTALATGYGRLKMAGFAEALRSVVSHSNFPLDEIRVVVRHESEAAVIRECVEGKQ